MTQIEWARAVAEHPEGHSRADVERACSVLAERLAEVERRLDQAIAALEPAVPLVGGGQP